MELFIPTHIYSERDCVDKKGDIFIKYGKRAMIVTGKNSSKANGSLYEVIDKLEEFAIDYILFDEIEENPSIETVMRARELGKNFGVEFVIGIGGGSPMDAAKAIAMMIKNSDLGSDVLYKSVELSHLPVIMIPTTAGTGSEVTPWAILTIHEKRTKSSISHKIYPSEALVDAKYLKDLSRDLLISTAVDTLCHLVESYLVTKATNYSKVYSQAGLEKWSEFKNNLLDDKLTEKDYELMMEASTLGGMAISHTGTGFPHALSYKITYECNVPHGIACGITLGEFVNSYYDKEERDKVISLLGFDSSESFKEYMSNLLGDIDIPEKVWDNSVNELLGNANKLATYNGTIDKSTVKNYYTK